MITKSPFLKKLIKFSEENGLVIRSEAGNFKSGYCTANGSNVVILNRRATEKTMCEILILALKFFRCPLPDDNEVTSFCNNELQNINETEFEIDLTERSGQ